LHISKEGRDYGHKASTKAGGVISPIELQNSFITLLTENPKGLTGWFSSLSGSMTDD